MLNVEMRTLRHRFDVACPDEAAFDTLRFIDARPQVRDIECNAEMIEVTRRDGFLAARMPSGRACESTADYMLAALHQVHFDVSRSEFAGKALIHGGTVTHEGRHVVIVGAKGAGKTTLLLRLLRSELAISGDEHIVVDGPNGIPRCRTLRVKETSMPLMDREVVQLVRARPFVRDWHGRRIFSVAPDIFGRPWVIERLPIADFVFLVPNHGGLSRLRQLSVDQALQNLLPENVLLPDSEKIFALANLRGLLVGARLWALENGNLDQCERLIYKLLEA